MHAEPLMHERRVLEAGKGDHRHLGDEETAYVFTSVDRLLDDCLTDVATWQRSSR